MAIYQILYWGDIPSQVKAWDDFDEVKIELSGKFMQEIDRMAQRLGMTETDDYLDQWRWSEEMERDGDPQFVADTLRNELEATMDG